MQTFLPYPDFYKSALNIDKKRCWKQVVETHQIIDILEGKTSRMQNHPAIKMWEGHVEALKLYFNVFLHVCVTNHRINTKYEAYNTLPFEEIVMPWWMGNEEFHRAMRARLLEKDYEYYRNIFKGDKGYNKGMYWWPVMESKTFRII